MNIRFLLLVAGMLFATGANAQSTTLAFSSDDFVVTPVFNNVAEFDFEIVINAALEPGVYNNPEISTLTYAVSGSLMNTPSGFPAFALVRTMSGDEFYAQGSSLQFEVSDTAVLTDGVQAVELVGAGVVFTFNGRENGNGRFHPALLELNADGTGRLQNSDNIVRDVPFLQVDFGEEYITDLAFDPGNLTMLTTFVPPVACSQCGTSGGGAISPLGLPLFALLLCLFAAGKRARYGFDRRHPSRQGNFSGNSGSVKCHS
jgi:hypothetical protein